MFSAWPLAAQNIDIESLAGLQFNFGNPGARSLGMGGAFIGLADDASAAEANPAGLTILRKPEFSIEGRNYAEQQVFTIDGTYPDLTRMGFTHYSTTLEPTFASFVYPIKNFTVGAYYHVALHNEGAGRDVNIQDSLLSGPPTLSVPGFYLLRDGGGPVTKDACFAAANQANDPFVCQHGTLLPFVSAVDVEERTIGLTGAYKIGPVSIGATARYQRFRETAYTFRLDQNFASLTSIVVQASSDIVTRNQKAAFQHDLTFAAGVKWTINDKLSAGAVYKQGARFTTPWFAATTDTSFAFEKGADTTFHIPDIYGIGLSFRPIPVLTVNADAVRVTYSNLTDHFVSINEDIRNLGNPFHANDVTEIHLGAEYFFSTKVPFALRAGAWRDPVHSIEYRGPLDRGNTLAREEAIASAILFPKGNTRMHYSVGAGFAWPRFQIDAAYDRSERYRIASISAVTRF
ncbi:MAG TPA: outer membrane protein transport protein [Thermoanaerobaculia bacterium]|nr:outer membrane protein transport protein [Thermoanaerobaculia bacterium]